MILIGTSGYNYPEWKGGFYPSDLPTSKMLAFYSERFSTVEINYTFYRLPSDKTVTNWANTTPASFTFTLKASRRITHDARLRDCDDLVELFLERARKLGPKLGVLLFQLPPYLRKNLDVFEQFTELIPEGTKAAFEFRHDSWHSNDVFDRLRARNLALCITDNEKTTTPLELTADYGYFRLRDEGYGESDIDKWADKIAAGAESQDDVFVYFKHEEQGKGAEFGETLKRRLGLA